MILNSSRYEGVEQLKQIATKTDKHGIMVYSEVRQTHLRSI